MKITEETLASFPKTIWTILEPWMNANIQIIAQLLKIDVWKQHNRQIEKIYYRIDYQKIFQFFSLCKGFKMS